ncbi:MarR family winged helix-turn-helix transcriptional regulator [Subtercola lobariae]|nr:MarR family transcriptional regulator [Subtercola lobariae]
MSQLSSEPNADAALPSSTLAASPGTIPATGLTPSLAADLRTVLGQLTRRLREQSNSGDFTHSQSAVLVQLERDGPTTMSALARTQGMRPQSMSTIVSALLEAGIVAGAPDANDRRKTLLSLTNFARNQIAAGRLAKEDWLLRAISTTLSPDEQEHLVTSIPVLRRLAQSL